ncbi:hypothetical protein DVH24_000588 [Malus domestica]|uniref:Uncharacterized protein n=1 Tax=Malus domestica TaxID=3750 RepID=A0A498IZY0_MALDO|nr:hypothetical protein DVH24_000588 [Malus domestica]
MWGEWEKEGRELGAFKGKVRYLAIEKGDNGKVAFLEGVVGLNLSSAMNVARHLSAETLPGLGSLRRLNYVKKIFFSDSSDGGFTGKNARRMMMHLSIPIDDDLQQTLSFFLKGLIVARCRGLDMLGSGDAAVRCLIESFPLYAQKHYVTYRTPNSPKQMLVPKLSVGRAIRSWPHILGCSTSMLKLMVEEIGELGIRNKKLGQKSLDIDTEPQEFLQKILVWLFHEFPFYVEDEIPKEFVVSFVEGLEFDKEIVGSIMGRCPKIFAASIGKTLKVKLEFLASIGVSEPHLPQVIKKYPELLVSDTDRTLLPRMKYLMKKGLSWRGIAFMVRKFSPLLGYSIEDVLSPKLEFLVNTMEKPVTDLVEYPRTSRIKPRYWVLKGRNIEFSLRDMLARNDEEFAEVYMGVGSLRDIERSLSSVLTKLYSNLQEQGLKLERKQVGTVLTN